MFNLALNRKSKFMLSGNNDRLYFYIGLIYTHFDEYIHCTDYCCCHDVVWNY